MKFLLLILPIVFAGCSVSNNPQRVQTRKLQKGIIKEDTSYVYSLPYEVDKKHLLVQGYFTRLTHKERVALDFKMKRGANICAARGGVVVRIKEDGNKGGLNKKFRKYTNQVVIRHDDGSFAGYWHLKQNGALVNVGDTIKQGQVIALCGKTGYTAFPHLHFIVWKFSPNNEWIQVPTRFKTNKGIMYLHPMHIYRNDGE
jgi:murein DD-endopeptidase MepM/ murein hydrolase activator NlpD